MLRRVVASAIGTIIVASLLTGCAGYRDFADPAQVTEGLAQIVAKAKSNRIVGITITEGQLTARVVGRDDDKIHTWVLAGAKSPREVTDPSQDPGLAAYSILAAVPTNKIDYQSAIEQSTLLRKQCSDSWAIEIRATIPGGNLSLMQCRFTTTEQYINGARVYFANLVSASGIRKVLGEDRLVMGSGGIGKISIFPNQVPGAMTIQHATPVPAPGRGNTCLPDFRREETTNPTSGEMIVTRCYPGGFWTGEVIQPRELDANKLALALTRASVLVRTDSFLLESVIITKVNGAIQLEVKGKTRTVVVDTDGRRIR